jgi:hypothetical protein
MEVIDDRKCFLKFPIFVNYGSFSYWGQLVCVIVFHMDGFV